MATNQAGPDAVVPLAPTALLLQGVGAALLTAPMKLPRWGTREVTSTPTTHPRAIAQTRLPAPNHEPLKENMA